jgi:integrase
MDMQKPKGLYRRDGSEIWCARKDVPVALRQRVGVTSLKKSLETSDLRIAIVRFHRVMAEFEQRLADARQPVDADLWKPFTMDVPPEMMKYMPQPTGPRLPVVLEEWARARVPTQNTVEEARRTVGQFIALNGDRVIGAYTVKHARAWCDLLQQNDTAHATKVKRFREIATLFKFAWRHNEEDMKENPFDRVRLERPKRAIAAKRPEWTLDQLRVWFISPIFTERYRPRLGEIAYWAVPLGLFHGMRLGEIAQLDRSDLVERDGVWCLLVRPSEDDEDEQGKSAKTDTSVRTVPLHRRVIELGFLDYAATLTGSKLFPGVRPDKRGRWSGLVSDWFGKYRKRLGLRERWVDFHGLRATWKTAANGAGLLENVHDAITGHDNKSVGRMYGGIPVAVLKEAIDRIDFDVVIPKWSASKAP